jgi:RNA polymerase sigma factor (TIGR02999 family)
MDPNRVPGEITALLGRWGEGDRAALADLVPLAYPDLRAIAIGYLHRERPDHTLQATALVNELYLRLARQKSVQVTSRQHFYTLAAMMMRQILADHARRYSAQKRPAAHERVPLHEDLAWINASNEDMVALDQAMAELETVAPRVVRCLELRVFLGCTLEETGDVMGISKATVGREIDFGVAWLYGHMFPKLKTT